MGSLQLTLILFIIYYLVTMAQHAKIRLYRHVISIQMRMDNVAAAIAHVGILHVQIIKSTAKDMRIMIVTAKHKANHATAGKYVQNINHAIVMKNVHSMAITSVTVAINQFHATVTKKATHATATINVRQLIHVHSHYLTGVVEYSLRKNPKLHAIGFVIHVRKLFVTHANNIHAILALAA